MTRRQRESLRNLTDEERSVLKQVSRGQNEPASHIARTKTLLAVADWKSYTEATQVAGRRSGGAVSDLVARFNQEGVIALEPRHGAVQ